MCSVFYNCNVCLLKRLCMLTACIKGTYDYDNYFGKLAANGGNYARLWLTDSAWDDLAVEVDLANMSLTNTW